MKKRLTRIFGDQLKKGSSKPIPPDTPVNVVLKTGETLFGRLINQNEASIRIEDQRFHPHEIALSRIDVIVFDYPSSW